MNREPRRLLDQAPRAGSTESHLRDLIARQSAAEPLSAAQLARVRRGIAARTETRQANWTIVAWAAAGAIVIATTSMGWAQNGSLGARIRDTGSQLVASVLGQPSRHRPRALPAAASDVAAAASNALATAQPSVALPEAPAMAPTAVPGLAPIPVTPVAPAAPVAAEAPLALPAAPRQPPARPAIAVPSRPNTLAAAPHGAPSDRTVAALAPTPTLTPPSATAPAVSPAVATTPLTAPVQGPLALEAESLREIAMLLRAPGAQADAALALKKLAVYRERFPDGTLAAEADLAELDADVALDRRAEALGLLARLERRGGTPPAELRLLHGELLAKGGDCAGALDRWGDGLPAAPALAERTLYGRASCYAALGRTGESRTAMGAYLSRFPQGRFAAAVRAAMVPKQP